MIPQSSYMAGSLLARRRNRRWIVAIYWGFMVPLTAFGVGRTFRHPQEWFVDAVTVLMVLNLWTITNGLTKPFGRPAFAPSRDFLTLFKGPKETREIMADWQFDEWETRRRDQVHFLAYRLVLMFSFGWFAILAFVQFLRPEWSPWLGPVFLCILIAILTALPQTLILWAEPDVEHMERAQ